MNQRTLEQFHRALVARERSLLRRRRQALTDEQELLAEREPDWEDAAANETGAALLERLSEDEAATLARIRASIERITRGTYGQCVACGGEIDVQRLRAVPETDRCGGCTNAH